MGPSGSRALFEARVGLEVWQVVKMWIWDLDRPELGFQPHHLAAVCPWAGFSMPLSVSF